MHFRRYLWHTLNGTPTSSERLAHRIDQFLLALIFLNVIGGIIETVPSIHAHWGTVLWWFDAISVGIFTVEYLGRLWSCTVDHRYRHPIRGRLRFLVTPLAIVDLLAIVPFYLPFILPGVDLRFLRAFRLVFRLLRFIRYSHTMTLLVAVVRSERRELVATMSVLVILLVFASSLMYYVEHPYQPEVFTDIPTAMWWALITLTTVGYGDMYPISSWGRIVGGLVAVLGIGLVALPTAILSTGFLRQLQRKAKKHIHRCPHCGAELDNLDQ